MFLFGTTLHGQMISNQTGQAFTDHMFFNDNFIRNNKIKTIQGSYSFKKNGDLIRKVPGSYTFTFDHAGQLASIVDLKWNGKKLDTLVNYFSYSEKGDLISFKKSEYGGITEQEMTYDSIDRLTKITNYRVSLDNKGNTIKRVEINQESIQYNGEKKTRYNSYGLPYLISFETYDEDGYKIASQEKLKRSGTISENKYTYTEKGLLKQILTFYDKKTDPVQTISFSYDAFGNMTERLEKKMNTLVKDLQVIFDTKTQLLHSIIRRNPNTNFMAIIRFTTYDYFD